MKINGKKLILFLLGFIVITYSIAWYYIADSLETSLNKSNLFYDTEEYSVNFGKFSKSGFPFKIGVACKDIVEKAQNVSVKTGDSFQKSNITTAYSAPLYVGYNLFSQNLYISYKGKASSQTDDKANGNDLSIDSSINFGYGFFDFIKLISKNFDNEEILKNLSYVKFIINDLTIKDIKTDKIFASTQNFILNIETLKSTRDQYIKFGYLLKGDFKESEIPYNYTSNNFLSFATYNSSINFEGTIDMKAPNKTTPLIDLISGLQIDITKYNVVSPLINGDGITKISIPENVFSDSPFIIESNHVDYIKDGFINSLITRPDLAAEHGIDKALKETLSKFKDPKTIKSSIDLSLSLSPLKISIGNFISLVDDIGFDISGEIFSTEGDNYNVDCTIILSQYQKILDSFINNYLILYEDNLRYLSNYSDIYYRAAVKTFRFLSQTPTLDSQNLEFKINGVGPLDQIKIGAYNIIDAPSYYYEFLFTEALSTLNDQQKTREAILEIIPFLVNYPDLFDSLLKQAGIQN
jgi:hypothetical protein